MGVPTTDHQVLKCIGRGDSVLITGQPTEGKTQAAYELLKGLGGFIRAFVNTHYRRRKTRNC